MSTGTHNLSAEMLKLAREHGIDLAGLELTNTDLELVRGGAQAIGMAAVGGLGAAATPFAAIGAGLGGLQLNK